MSFLFLLGGIMSNFYERKLSPPSKTFLLLGPRGTGKTTWLKKMLTPKVFINLLHSDQFFRYQANPAVLREDLKDVAAGEWVVVDEAQRVTELLNEIHSLYESKGIQFAITGSSARKLKRAQANLLAGRAVRCDLFPFAFEEIKDPDLIEFCVEFGSLPPVISEPEMAADILSAYVETYLKEEIATEAVTRQLEPFARFLRVAAQYHGQHLNVESVARESSVKRRTVDNYFGILEDTLLGFRLPALQLNWRVKETAHPKFYFFDSGVARAASGWIRETMPDSWRGFSFESLVINEIRAYNSYQRKERSLFHYDVAGSLDIDIIIETQRKILQRPSAYVAVEVKYSKRWNKEWSQSLIAIASDQKSRVTSAYGVYLGNDVIVDGPLTILPFAQFSEALWQGKIF
jgi:predicted AAA+ superfamily ATPase